MSSWRDTHSPMKDPLFDDSLAPFHVNDVAALVYECDRLRILEQKVIRALGPPSKWMRFDITLNKLVEDASDGD